MDAQASGDPVAAYLQTQPPRLRSLAAAVRRFIRATAPELDETIKWGQPAYVFGTHNVLYLAVYADHVDLGFFEGALLEDTDRLLEGTGARLRHVKVRRTADLEQEGLRSLVRGAVAKA